MENSTEDPLVVSSIKALLEQFDQTVLNGRQLVSAIENAVRSEADRNLYIADNDSKMFLDVIEGEDSVIASIELTAFQAETLSACGVEEV